MDPSEAFAGAAHQYLFVLAVIVYATIAAASIRNAFACLKSPTRTERPAQAQRAAFAEITGTGILTTCIGTFMLTFSVDAIPARLEPEVLIPSVGTTAAILLIYTVLRKIKGATSLLRFKCDRARNFRWKTDVDSSGPDLPQVNLVCDYHHHQGYNLRSRVL